MSALAFARARRAAALCCCLFAGAATAQWQRVDHSASPRHRVPPQLALDDAGRPLAASPFAEAAQLRFGRVDYRLATAAWVGRNVRLAYVVPALVSGLRSADGLRVDWRGLAPLASGSARPGERVVVWSGRVESPWMVVALEPTAHVDLRQLELRGPAPFAFECHFEIETLP